MLFMNRNPRVVTAGFPGLARWSGTTEEIRWQGGYFIFPHHVKDRSRISVTPCPQSNTSAVSQASRNIFLLQFSHLSVVNNSGSLSAAAAAWLGKEENINKKSTWVQRYNVGIVNQSGCGSNGCSICVDIEQIFSSDEVQQCICP